MIKSSMVKGVLIFFSFIIGFIVLFSQDSLLSVSQKEAIEKALSDINKAPDFTLKAINDSTYTLSKLEGNVVLINFWATWCGPCRMEIPEFNELYEKYHDEGFELLGISISDTKKQLKNYTNSYKVKYPLLYGSANDLNKITTDFGGVYAVPSSFLVDKNGEMVWSYPGAILKNYDPQTFADLIYKIEKELKAEE